MKKAIFFLVFLGLSFSLSAKMPSRDTAREKPWKKYPVFFQQFSFGFPIVNFDYDKPIKSKSQRGLAQGMNYYFYNQQPSVGTFFPVADGYFSFRIISFFYKDIWGAEIYYGGYGSSVKPDGYQQYISSQFPNYFTGNLYPNNFYQFEGLQFGLAYKKHIGRYVIEPKLQLGLEQSDSFSAYGSVYYFKEIGSNRFTTYTIAANVLNKQMASLHVQLNLARRFNMRSAHYKMEIGVKSEYLCAPYRAAIKITTQPYGGQATSSEVDFKATYQLFSFGGFIAFFIGK